MRQKAYINGQILTMDRGRPEAEALLLCGKRIRRVGSTEEIRGLLRAGARVVDLEGRTMLPGFICTNASFMAMAYENMFGNAAPGGFCNTREALLRELSWQEAGRGRKPGAWFVALGYEPEGYGRGPGLERKDLDRISRGRPICLVYASGQAGILNSQGLLRLGIGRFTPDPPGGRIERCPETRMPTGVLRGTAFFQAVERMEGPSLREALQGVERAVDLFASRGITTLAEAVTEAGEYEMLHLASLVGRLRLDVIPGPRPSPEARFPLSLPERLRYHRHCRQGSCDINSNKCSCFGGEPGNRACGRKAAPHMLGLVQQAVSRQLEKRGDLSQEGQRRLVEEALGVVTMGSAIEIFEERKKGSILEGKLADLVILDRNPLTSSLGELGEIQVLETIKEGKSIFRRLAGGDKER